MTAISLLRHAIGLLTQQPLKTLAVVSPGLVVMVAVSVISAMTTPQILTSDSFQNLASSWLLLVGLVVGYSMMAILWHRHTLSSTRAPLPMSIKLVFNYLWCVIMLTFIQLAVGLVMVLPLVMSSQSGTGPIAGPAFRSVMLTTFVTQLLLVWLSLRLSLILPAAAIGRPIRMALSWRYTQALSRPLWSIAAILALFNTTLTGLVSYFDLTKPHHALVVEMPVYVVEGLLIFSILTTLYARQVQKTPLNVA